MKTKKGQLRRVSHDFVSTAAFSPDGKRVVTARSDLIYVLVSSFEKIQPSSANRLVLRRGARGLQCGNSPVVRAAVDRLRLLRYGRRHVAVTRPAHRKSNRAINVEQTVQILKNMLQPRESRCLRWLTTARKVKGGNENSKFNRVAV
jgi:hypothetical protein